MCFSGADEIEGVDGRSCAAELRYQSHNSPHLI